MAPENPKDQGVQSNALNGAPDIDKLRYLHHQLNQPLTAISNYCQTGCCLIDQGMGDAAQLRALFEKISLQSSRANGLSQELGKELGRRDDQESAETPVEQQQAPR